MEKSNDKFVHIKVKELKPGQKFVGEYRGSYKDQKYGDTRYLIKNKDTIYVFKALAKLKELFTKVKKGDIVSITFLKSTRLASGNFMGEFTYKIGAPVEGDEADSDSDAQAEAKADSDDMPF